MSRSWGVNGTAAQTTAIQECEMILGHLRGSDGDRIDPDFLRVHSVSLLQLVGEISRAEVPSIMRSESDDLSYLFQGAA
jgi:hypothetical protein